MTKMEFYAPEEHSRALQDLRKIPFAKTDDGYRFAYWVYDLNDTEEKHEELENSFRGKEAAELLDKAKKELEAIVVSEDEYLGWTVHQKEKGGIKQYHDAIHNLSIGLLLLTIDKKAESVTGDGTEEDNVFYGHRDISSLYTLQRNQSPEGAKCVLNRNNPFADVTIKSQQYYYKTADGDTETLFFNTNNIVEKVDKNGHDMLTMRPGFTVSKEHGVVQRPMQKVTFANSVTEPIVGDEDHIYVHID